SLRMNGIRIVGRVLDSRTGRGIEAASVQLHVIMNGNGLLRDSLVAGMFTRNNGDFSFDNVPAADSLRLSISGIGYKDWQRTVVQDEAGPVTDLGNIGIEPDAQVLSNVVITAQRPAMEMGIDRRTFSVERSLVSTGGTALDVMRNIPSVSVDVDGNVQLRSTQPQIFVDGRPTILTLDQIPADQIERVELITNPSAKFDAASSGGIINIIMKRNRRMGLNGIVSAGAGHPGILNGNLTLNARQGKFNLFASGGYNQTGGRARGKTLRQNKKNGIIENYFNQYSTNENKRRFGSARFGLDYFASVRTTLSFTQNITGGKFGNEEEQDQEYLNSLGVAERFGKRQAESSSRFNRYNSQFNYSHKFPEQGKELTGNINYSYGKGSDAASILNSFFFPNGTPYSTPARVRNEGRNDNDQLTIQIDFTDPHGENSKTEFGLRTNITDQRSYFSSFSVDNGQETLLPLSNNYAYKETVHAGYFSYSNKIRLFSYQAGLRAEVSEFEGELLDSAKTFGYRYPQGFRRLMDALFPSLFLTRELGEDAQLQVNYTRRIRRPNFWQLNPFIDINDPVNLRQGNPELRPEFINSFEFNYDQRYDKGSFLGVLYYRNNIGDITRYSDTISAAQYQQLNNAAIDPNAILNTFINASSTNRLGAELTLQHRFSEGFDIVPTIDLQYRKVNADVGGLQLSNQGFTYEGQLTLNYRITSSAHALFKDLAFQLMGEYESREVTAQGRNAPQHRVDFALRKDFGKDKKASFTFNINDVFNSYRFGNIFDTETFYQESYRRRNVRSFRLNFTYKFGKENFSLTRRQEDRGGDRDDD
ncbi:MAG TPA: TonB dependent receptor, partial [Flavisolibacter sp.]|nr:TonB dependent receptor [Flavisolibacter sp.]